MNRIIALLITFFTFIVVTFAIPSHILAQEAEPAITKPDFYLATPHWFGGYNDFIICPWVSSLPA